MGWDISISSHYHWIPLTVRWGSKIVNDDESLDGEEKKNNEIQNLFEPRLKEGSSQRFLMQISEEQSVV